MCVCAGVLVEERRSKKKRKKKQNAQQNKKRKEKKTTNTNRGSGATGARPSQCRDNVGHFPTLWLLSTVMIGWRSSLLVYPLADRPVLFVCWFFFVVFEATLLSLPRRLSALVLRRAASCLSSYPETSRRRINPFVGSLRLFQQFLSLLPIPLDSIWFYRFSRSSLKWLSHGISVYCA